MAKKKTVHKSTKTRRYFASAHASFNDKQAERLGAEIENISAKQSGETELVTPHQLLDYARTHKRSALHEQFEWDDTRAAEKHRVWQARHLLGAIEIEVTIRGKRHRQRAFHNVSIEIATDDPDDEPIVERGYLATPKIKTRKDASKQVVTRAYRELVRWQTKYALYQQYFGKVPAAIEDLKVEVNTTEV